MFKLRNLLTLLALAASVVILPACGKGKCAKDSNRKENHHRRGGKRHHKGKKNHEEKDRNFLFRK